MSTILMLCFIVYAAFSWVQIKKIAKHDGVLFPFCQLRRDIMKFRFDEIMQPSMKLSRDERESLRRLSSALDNVIHNYSRHKKMMFNIRTVIAQLRKHQSALKKIEPLKLTDNKDIRNFYVRFGYCSAKAFLAYTPLILWEFVLRLLVRVAPIIWHISKSRAEQLSQDMISVRQDKQRYARMA